MVYVSYPGAVSTLSKIKGTDIEKLLKEYNII